MKVYVVVLNWNGKDFINSCLDSLAAQNYKHKLIVVDNGSKDGSIEIIEKFHPEALLIKMSENHGFAGGVNIGIRQAMKDGADAVVLFNNDALAGSRWLESLVNTMEHTAEAGIITGKLMQIDKKHLDSTGEFYSIFGMPFPRGRNKLSTEKYNKQENIFGATGGASLYRVKMLEEIGLFDEDFFAYYEDVDISFRAQLAGWKVVYTPLAIAYHHISGTSSKLGSFSRYHSIKNFHLLYLKNMPGILFWKYLPLFLLQGLRLAISSTVRLKLLTYLKGLARAITLVPSVVKKRRLIQSSRKVSLSYIDSILIHGRPRRIPTVPRDKNTGQ